MDWGLVILAVVIMTGAGLLMGALLAVASIRFHVEVDPRIEKVREILPGSNCGACGLPGCDAAAEAIAQGAVAYSICVAGGQDVSEEVARLMGVETEEEVEVVATVLRCQGGKEKVSRRYWYNGVATCHAAGLVAGGPLACPFGCLGFGDCYRACPFDAIIMGDDGLPKIDLAACTRCGICVKTCPRNIIAFMPESSEVVVLCVSHDKGKVVRLSCSVGCIACKACERVCEPGAISVVDNLAAIDYEKCTGCGACVEKCPTKCLVLRIITTTSTVEAQ